jgi:hypothetical protein
MWIRNSFSFDVLLKYEFNMRFYYLFVIHIYSLFQLLKARAINTSLTCCLFAVFICYLFTIYIYLQFVSAVESDGVDGWLCDVRKHIQQTHSSARIRMSSYEEYLAFVTQAQGHALISDLLAELLLGLDDRIKELHIESQLLPQLVGFAKDVIDECMHVNIPSFWVVFMVLDGVFRT